MKRQITIFIVLLLTFLLGGLTGFLLGSRFTQRMGRNLLSTPKDMVESNFGKDKDSVSEITLLAGGDLMLGRTVGYKMVEGGNFNWPFEKVSDVIRSVDFSFFNLESPFCHNCPLTNSGMIFCADYRAIDGVVFAGIDGVNLANNHIKNCGEEGLKETKAMLDGSNIGHFGEGENLLIVELKGVKFAFLGFNEVGVSGQEYQNLKIWVQKEIERAKVVADVVIVSFHWGQEYTKKISSHQKELAYLAIKAGADVVVGHHPHWVQEREVYRGKPVYYSLGNFVFDQMWSEETRRGVLLKMIFNGKNLAGEELLPFEIFDFGQPTLYSQ